MKDFTAHLQHYLPLFGLLVACVIGFVIFSYDNIFRMAVVSAASLSYIVWGIVHHHIHGDLHLSVIVEYIAVAALGVVIAFSVLYWT
jgi:hypothetical protein